MPVLESFCDSASAHLSDLEKRLSTTDSRFKTTAERFGEKQIDSHDFFKTFSEFFASLSDAKAENEKREQERRDQARQEKLKLERQERISRTASKVKIFFLQKVQSKTESILLFMAKYLYSGHLDRKKSFVTGS